MGKGPGPRSARYPCGGPVTEAGHGAGREASELQEPDGGESVCGGYGTVLARLPSPPPTDNPSMTDFVRGPQGEDLCEDFTSRPVLAL